MPKTKISEFSATPGNNTDIDGINIAEGCPPSGINDAIRELMSQLKDFQAGTAGDSFNGPIGTTTPAAGVFTNLSASGTFALTGDQVQISEGGTGQTTANAAFNALAPSQSTHAGKYLKTDGTNTSWDALDISTADITGTLPIANGGTGLTALGTGVQTALGIAVGSSGAFVVNGGALGTPSSGTVTNLTGTASININGTVGATTPTTGAFTTLSASGNITVSGGTANGVAYLNGSKVLTTGGTLTFDGTTLRTGTSSTTSPGVKINMDGVGTQTYFALTSDPLTIFSINRPSGSNNLRFDANYGGFVWGIGSAGTATEAMRLDSTGLGIGTSSPSYKLDVQGTEARVRDSGNVNFAALNIFTGVSLGGNGAGTRGIQTTAADALTFGTNSTERMRLDSSGNLGLGVTPSAWGGGYTGLQVKTGASIWSANSAGAYYSNNVYFDGTNRRYVFSGPAFEYSQDSAGHRWYTAPSGTAGNAISFTQAMTLDASGNLGVGTTSPGSKLQVESATATAAASGITVRDSTNSLNCQLLRTGATYSYAGVGALETWLYSQGTSNLSLGPDGAGAVKFVTNGSERARITSGGNLLVGTTAQIGSERFGVDSGSGACGKFKGGTSANVTIDAWNPATTGDNIFLAFRTETAETTRGTITYNRTAGLTAYNTTSDYRAKDITGPVTDSGALIDSVPVYMGKMKGATQERPMFIAHETPAYAHTGEKDAVDADGNPVYQQMDASALVPVLWAELQSLRARVAQLEAK